MAFPGAPTNLETRLEGGVTYQYLSASNTWIIQDQSGSGGTDLSIGTVTTTTVDILSDNGADATIPAATNAAAGVATAAQITKLEGIETSATADQTGAEIKAAYEAEVNTNAFTDSQVTKLTGIETGATADQTATEVVSSASGNLAATNVQAALEELQADIDTLTGLNAQNLISGSGVPGGGLGEDGEYYYDVDSGDYYGPKTGGAWGAAVANDRTQVALADATTVNSLAGAGGVATTAARSDHSHIDSRGSVFPPTDGTGGIRHVSSGHASAPDGNYVLIGTAWVQS